MPCILSCEQHPAELGSQTERILGSIESSDIHATDQSNSPMHPRTIARTCTYTRRSNDFQTAECFPKNRLFLLSARVNLSLFLLNTGRFAYRKFKYLAPTPSNNKPLEKYAFIQETKHSVLHSCTSKLMKKKKEE